MSLVSSSKIFGCKAAINRLKEGKYVRRLVPPKGYILLAQSIFKLRKTGLWRSNGRYKRNNIWRKYGTLDEFKKEFCTNSSFIICDVKGKFYHLEEEC